MRRRKRAQNDESRDRSSVGFEPTSVTEPWTSLRGGADNHTGTPMTTNHNDLTITYDGPVLRLTLTRAARRNALSRVLVATLQRTFSAITVGGDTRVVVLAGDGPVFCAGADITEFVDAAHTDQSRADADGLADLLEAMTACPVPIVARVHGAAFGGAVGLICASDVAIAAADTTFALSEARLGIIPAVISPSVIAALGPRAANARMLLAAPFGAADALRSGLVHEVAPLDDLDAAVEDAVANLLRCAPGALAAIKRLPSLLNAVDPDTIRATTTGLLVERLASAEGQEGLRAFVEKRPASWVPASEESR